MGSLASMCARSSEEAEAFADLTRLNSSFIGTIYAGDKIGEDDYGGKERQKIIK